MPTRSKRVCLPSYISMSAYDPYRFLPPQVRPSGSSSNHPKIFVPRYGSPDLDLNRPMSDHPESHDTNGGGQGGEYEREDHANGNGAGPSRKRARADDDARAGQAGGRTSMEGQQTIDHARQQQRQRPIPMSMFGLDARNDLTREIGNWIVNTCQGLEDIEVSAHPQRSSVSCH